LRELKLLTYFVHDFNDEVCRTKAVIPDENPLNPSDMAHLRYSFRSDGKSGWLFVNNYVRRNHCAEHKNVTLSVPPAVCPDSVTFPPMDIRDGDYFFLPFNMKCGDAVIESATVTPFCRIRDLFVFYARENVNCSADFFKFNADSSAENKRNILVLARKDALNAWKSASGSLIITDGVLMQNEFGEDVLSGRGEIRFAAYPPLKKVPSGFVYKGSVSKNLYKDGTDFEFAVYENESCCDISSFPGCVYASEAESIPSGKKFRVDVSSITDFLRKKQGENGFCDCFIRFFYEGNKARLYATVNGERKLIADNFFSGAEYAWEIGLKRFLQLNTDFSALELEIDTLKKTDEIFFESPVHMTGGKVCRLLCTGFEYEWSCVLQSD
jgi:hypothetical protein